MQMCRITRVISSKYTLWDDGKTIFYDIKQKLQDNFFCEASWIMWQGEYINNSY